MSIGIVGGQQNNLVKRIGMISSLFIFITGIGLVFKTQVDNTIPVWVALITFLWLILAIGAPIVAKKAKVRRIEAYYFFMGIAGLAVLVAVTKLKF